jgi:hypothetical protein
MAGVATGVAVRGGGFIVVTSWFSVKSVAAVVDVLVKITALAAALIAANFFLFRAHVSHQVTAGQGVTQQIVRDAYNRAGEQLPLVVRATMADIQDARHPARYAYPGELTVPQTDVLCQFFPAHVRAVSGSKGACTPGGQGDPAVDNMSRAQVLLLENNDTSFLYRDSKSWAVRNHQPIPSVYSEIFPEAILSAADIGKAWSRLRIALVDRAVVQVSNAGSADALEVRISAPVGWSSDHDDAFSVPAHHTVSHEFTSAGAAEKPGQDSFSVSWSTGVSPLGVYAAIAIVVLGLLTLGAGLIADLKRSPAPAS